MSRFETGFSCSTGTGNSETESPDHVFPITWWVLTLHHVVVGVVSDGEEMGRHFRAPLAPVLADDVLCVDGQTLVRVDGHTEQA